MAGCIFRLLGSEMAVDEHVAATSLPVYKHFKTGDDKYPHLPVPKKHETNGLVVKISNDEREAFAEQVQDAETFIYEHKDELKRLIAMPDIETATLDFAWEITVGRNEPPRHYHFFPPSFLTLCGPLNIGIVVSVYPKNTNRGLF